MRGLSAVVSIAPHPQALLVEHAAGVGLTADECLFEGRDPTTPTPIQTTEVATTRAPTTQACRLAPAPAGPACPYDLDTIPDLPTLLWRHQQYQTAVLLGAGSVSGSGSSSSSNSSRPRAQVVLVNSNDLVGLGNRVPAVVTGEGGGVLDRPQHAVKRL